MPDLESTSAAFAAAEGRAPDPAQLEASIRERREQLRDHVRTLERIVRAKLDVRGRIRRARYRAIARFQLAAEDFVQRVRERPLPYLVAGVALFLLLTRRRRPAPPV